MRRVVQSPHPRPFHGEAADATACRRPFCPGAAMPRICGNIEQQLLPALRQIWEAADRADFCVGCFYVLGWKQLDQRIERWSGGADGYGGGSDG